jgi:hypothetical protein
MKSRPLLPPIDPNQRYTPEESAAYLRSSRWSVFMDIREGRLASFKDGKRRYIAGSELIRRSSPEWAARKAAETGSEPRAA